MKLEFNNIYRRYFFVANGNGYYRQSLFHYFGQICNKKLISK